MSETRVSIIICTCNRADHLRLTLASMASVCVPKTMPTELIVVDNASTDHTAEVVRSCRLPNMIVRCIHEPKRGLSHARNTGIVRTEGKIILFTDDDVRPPKNWLLMMVDPILSGEADVVGGGLTMAEHLKRFWMETTHIATLSCTDAYDKASFTGIIGGNMGFSRSVISKVPAFDTELGAGALGFSEESLFTHQATKAGFRSKVMLHIAMEHHFDPSRLTRASFMKAAVNSGRSQAYLAHHWEHQVISDASIRFAKLRLRAFYHRLRHARRSPKLDFMPGWEISLIHQLSYYRQYLTERKRRRNYEKYGFVKIE